MRYETIMSNEKLLSLQRVASVAKQPSKKFDIHFCLFIFISKNTKGFKI